MKDHVTRTVWIAHHEELGWLADVAKDDLYDFVKDFREMHGDVYY